MKDDLEFNMKCILKSQGQGGYELFRIPGMVCMDSGKILVYYENRKAESDWALSDIGVRSSMDGGRTWSEEEILARGGQQNVNNPVMFADGLTLCFIFHMGYRRTFCRRSLDEGRTWSQPEEITESLKTPDYDWTVVASGPGHGTVLRNGRYVVPVWMCSNHENPKLHYPSILTTLYSDDRGKSWHLGELIDKDYMKNPSETALAELPDGTIMINIRHEAVKRRRVIAYSNDGSGGWHGFHFEEALPDPVCMGGMVARNGKTYFVNCHSETERKNLTVFETRDGAEWKKLAKISESAGYSDLAASPDGKKLYIFYEEFSTQNRDLVFTVLDISR